MGRITGSRARKLKSGNGVKVHIPRGASLDEAGIAAIADQAAYVLSRIVYHSRSNRKSPRLVPLNSKHLKAMVGRTWPNLRKLLIQHRYIVCNEQYRVSSRSQRGYAMEYGLHTRFAGCRCKMHELLDRGLVSRIQRERRRRKQSYQDDATMCHLQACIEKLDIPQADAHAAIRKHYRVGTAIL